MFYQCSNNIKVLCNKNFNAKIYLFIVSMFCGNWPYYNLKIKDKHKIYNLYNQNVEKIDRRTFYKYYQYMIDNKLILEYDDDLLMLSVNENCFLDASVIDILIQEANNLTVQLYLYLFFMQPKEYTEKVYFYISDFVEFSGRPRSTGGARTATRESLKYLIDKGIVECEFHEGTRCGTKKRLFKVH